LRNLHTDFHGGCTNLYSHQKCIRSFLPILSSISFYFLDDCYLIGIRWDLSVV
jgi:hypothetical protein